MLATAATSAITPINNTILTAVIMRVRLFAATSTRCTFRTVS